MLDAYVLGFDTNASSENDDAAVGFQMTILVRRLTFVEAAAGTYQPATDVTIAAGGVPATHTLARGETLSLVAGRYGLDWRVLQRLNEITDQQLTRLPVGMVIRLR
jgi:LysM repeat protein